MGIGQTGSGGANVARLRKLIAVAMAVSAALVLLGGCARQGQATAPPEGMRLTAETLVPSGVAVSALTPSPTPWLETAGEPSATSPSTGDPAPSAAAVSIPVAPGATGPYTVTIRSPGPDLTRGIALTGVLSSGVAPLQAEISPGCGRTGRDVRCDLGDLQAGDVATVTLDLSSPGPETLIAGPGAPAEATSALAATDLVVQASGPSSVLAGQPVTYTYTISNRGESDATGVHFEDAIPSDMNLVAYAPGLPDCDQEGDALTCTLHDPSGGKSLTFTLIITGLGEQPMVLGLDPLLPGWPICTVLKERTWLHIVQCELGDLKPGQATRVQLVLTAIGVVERTTENAASVRADEADLSPADNTITTTITVQTRATPAEDTAGGE